MFHSKNHRKMSSKLVTLGKASELTLGPIGFYAEYGRVNTKWNKPTKTTRSSCKY